MQDFFQFVMNHWFLWSLFIAILALLFWFEMRTQVGGVMRLDPAQTVNLINREQAVVVDIRDAEAFRAGHIIDAVHIPFSDLQTKYRKLQKNKQKPIIMVDSSGQVGPKAGIQLKQLGFEKIYTLNGGISAWRNASLPLTQK